MGNFGGIHAWKSKHEKRAATTAKAASHTSQKMSENEEEDGIVKNLDWLLDNLHRNMKFYFIMSWLTGIGAGTWFLCMYIDTKSLFPGMALGTFLSSLSATYLALNHSTQKEQRDRVSKGQERVIQSD